MKNDAQAVLVAAADAVSKRRVAYHGGVQSPDRPDRFMLVLGAPNAVKIPGGTMLCVGISAEQATALGEQLLAWARGGAQ